MRKGSISLAEGNPSLAAQWHPTKNGELTPDQVALKSNRKVWWLFPYDDPETGRHFDFEWEAIINNRVKGCDCPFLSGRAVWPGFNDLQTRNPQLASQWHPTRNGNLTPSQVALKSTLKVWWLFPYDAPETSRHFDFEWEAIISNRAQGDACPFLSGQAVWPGFNDLQTRNPQLASQWHPTRNGDLTPSQVTLKSAKKVWWLFPYDDPETGRHFDFEWEAIISNRVQENGCPFLSRQAVWPGFNDLQTRNPQLASQWHPTKNGNLTPDQVTFHSTLKVWWLFPYDDPKTGKHFDFEWEATIEKRKDGASCPFLSGRAVWPGFNDLQTQNPQLAVQWHPTKNGRLKPSEVTQYSNKLVWWQLPYDDPDTGNHYDFEWTARIYKRSNHEGCPFLCGKQTMTGFNDLQTKYPDIAAEWHPTKNRWVKPTQVTAGSHKKVWWLCSQCDHEWRSAINTRTSLWTGCPRCARRGFLHSS